MAARRASVDDAARGLMTGIGATVAVIGLVLLIWPGSGVVAISWVIAFGALLFSALMIFLGLRLKRLQQRIDSRAATDIFNCHCSKRAARARPTASRI